MDLLNDNKSVLILINFEFLIWIHHFHFHVLWAYGLFYFYLCTSSYISFCDTPLIIFNAETCEQLISYFFQLVFSSSATVYGSPKEVPCTEEYPLCAINPYGRTKVFFYSFLLCFTPKCTYCLSYSSVVCYCSSWLKICVGICVKVIVSGI